MKMKKMKKMKKLSRLELRPDALLVAPAKSNGVIWTPTRVSARIGKVVLSTMSQIQKGDRVLYHPVAGLELTDSRRTYLLLDSADVLALLEG